MISKTGLFAVAAVLPLLALTSDARADVMTGTPAIVSVEVVLMPVLNGANVTPRLTCGDIGLVAVPVNSFPPQTYYSSNMVQSVAGPGVCIVNQMRVPSGDTKINGQPTQAAYVKLIPHPNAACPYGVAFKYLGDDVLGPISLPGGAKVGNMGALVVQSWACAAPPPVTK
jgi:hypothetical protein